MSSYQLELVPTARFDVAVLLNITPDHLDRHGGMAGYIAAKRRIFDRQRGAGLGRDRHRRRILAARSVDGLTEPARCAAIAIGRDAPGAIGRAAASGITVSDGS